MRLGGGKEKGKRGKRLQLEEKIFLGNLGILGGEKKERKI